MKEKKSFQVKEVLRVKNISIYLWRTYFLLFVFIRSMTILGCICYRGNGLHDICYASIAFLNMIFVCEYDGINKREKILWLSVLSGTVASFYDESFFFLLVLFVINIVWAKIAEGKSCRNTLCDMIKVLFGTMTVLEIYSIFAFFNTYLYEQIMNTSFLFQFLDVFFAISVVSFFIADKENIAEVSYEETELKKKKYNAQLTKRCMWCFLVVVVLAIMGSTFYIEFQNEANEFCLFMGKSINRGYLYCENNENVRIYFAQRDAGIGTVLENAASYRWLEAGEEFFYQKLALYLGKYLVYFFYGIIGVLVTSAGLVAYMLNRIYQIKFVE